MPTPTRASGRSGLSCRALRNSFSAAPGRRCSNNRQPPAISSCGSGGPAGGEASASSSCRWHFLYFLPEPHAHGSLRPVCARRSLAVSGELSAAFFFSLMVSSVGELVEREDTTFGTRGLRRQLAAAHLVGAALITSDCRRASTS